MLDDGFYEGGKMRSKPKKNNSDCGFCEVSCGSEWCSSKSKNPCVEIAEQEGQYSSGVLPIVEVSKEDLEKKYPKQSILFLRDLIKYYGGEID